jgi:ribosome maturation factor RimP
MRFDLYITPTYQKNLEVGQEITLTLDNKTFNATIVAIDGNKVTHEVTGDEEEMLRPYLEPQQMSFSISSRSVN